MNPVAIRAVKIVGGVFLAVGLTLVAGAGWAGFRQYTILKHWPAVDAVVTQSRVTSRLETATDSDTHRSSTTRMYSVELEFRYTLAGREFSTPASSPYSTSVYSTMKRKADEYAQGTHHQVRYNPDNPNDIRYDVGLNFGFVFLPALLGFLGIVFSGVGGGLLTALWRVKLRVCPSCGQGVSKGQLTCPKCGAALPVN